MSEGEAERATGAERPSLLLLVVAALLVLSPVGFAGAALAFSPAGGPSQAVTVPVLPHQEPGAGASLAGLIVASPAVVPSGDPSYHDFQISTLRDPAAAARVFLDAWHALLPSDAPPATHALLRNLERAVLQVSSHRVAVASSGESLYQRFAPALHGVLQAVPENANRLDNAATGLQYLSLCASYSGQPLPALDGIHLEQGPDLPLHLLVAADALRTFAARLFPQDVLDQLTTVNATSAPTVVSVMRGIGIGTPQARTAHIVAAEIVARDDGCTECTPVTRLLQPLLDHPSTRPLGLVTQGTIDETAARTASRNTTAFQIRQRVEAAINSFDAALNVTGDPGIFAARAGALDTLAQQPGVPHAAALQAAIASQEQATRRAPRDVTLWVELARLQEEAGDGPGVRASAAAALRLTRPPWNPRLATLLPLGCNGSPADLDLGEWHDSLFGHAGEDVLCYSAATAVFADNLVSQYDPQPIDQWQIAGFSPDEARRMATVGGILTGDLQTPAGSIATWNGLHQTDQVSPSIQDGVAAAVLASGQSPPAGSDSQAALDLAQTILRYAGQFGTAARLCARPISGVDPAFADTCAGESDYLEGHYSAATPEFLRAFDATARSPTPGTDPYDLLLEAGAAAQHAGKISEARNIIGCAAGFASLSTQGCPPSSNAIPTPPSVNAPPYPYARIVALDKLGDLDLARGLSSPHAALFNSSLQYYAAAINAFNRTRSFVLGWTNPAGNEELALQSTQDAWNNAGVALLMLAPRALSGPDARAPDCLKTGIKYCREAERAFLGADAVDPSNPIALMNLAWVRRLEGGPAADAAVRQDLSQAAQDYPTLYPALNDYGVLEADAKQYDAARSTFQQALVDFRLAASGATTESVTLCNPGSTQAPVAQPSMYGLATWNLGLADLQGVPHDIVGGHLGSAVANLVNGQILLARAAISNPSFRRDELEYKHDNNVYCFVTGSTPRTGFGLASNYGLPTLGLPVIGILGILSLSNLLLLGRMGLADKGKETLAERMEEQAPSLETVLRRRYRRLLRSGSVRRLLRHPSLTRVRRAGAPQRRRLAAILTLAILLLALGLTATQENPIAVFAILVLTFVAVLVAAATHELGHLAAAYWAGVTVQRRAWVPGLVLSVLLLATPASLGLRFGPYLGHEIEGEAGEREWWVYAGGPIANLLMSVVSYGMYWVEPAPFFRILAFTQLLLGAYSLLPIEQLDGKHLEDRRRPATALTFVVAVLVMAFELRWV